jgi:peptide/nickel transport system permease protein
MTNVALDTLGPALEPVPPAQSRGRPSNHPVARFLLRRMLSGIVTLLVVSVLIFFTLHVIPGDVARTILGRDATPQAIADLRNELGLNASFLSQYLGWIGGLLHGDLGDSATALARNNTDPAVWGVIGTPLRNSIYLAVITAALLIPLGMLLGVWAAVRVRKLGDHVISVSALTLGSMPEFLVATILIAVFFLGLDLLPPIVSIGPGETPLSHADQLVLPVATLLAVCLAFTIRMVRAGTIEALQQDYVAMARLNGVPERRVLWHYGLRNALTPSVQAIGQTIQYLAGGIIITESVFNYPGIGRALVQAVSSRDITTVADITLILATFYIAVNIAADLIVVLIVPKLRTAL